MSIHFGPSKNLECHVHECGRAGRDGQPSSCLLLHHGLFGANCMHDIKDSFANNTDCRLTYQYSHFPGKFTSSVSGHQCCDICAKTCGCQREICKEHSVLVLDANEGENLSFKSVCSVVENDKVHLRTELINYMKNLLFQNSSGAVASVDIYLTTFFQ